MGNSRYLHCLCYNDIHFPAKKIVSHDFYSTAKRIVRYAALEINFTMIGMS